MPNADAGRELQAGPAPRILADFVLSSEWAPCYSRRRSRPVPRPLARDPGGQTAATRGRAAETTPPPPSPRTAPPRGGRKKLRPGRDGQVTTCGDGPPELCASRCRGGSPEQPPLEAVQVVDAALALRRCAPQFEAKVARIQLLPEIVHRAGADILQAVPDALGEVRHEAVHAALV
eukprot:CAMPEP_0170357350 /NCGR_PEP_ID=MMETSP0117_2-20130122/1661_1 /TAXON_ID=400756 /ORGANISM="Durinskia baltica, Strain CSIRO CS-38" /LENGTH=175 /DNA_ID=CAMNT_0010611513 /DNA_START=24 /DNA_END=548 /DNA_ORIENTATION=+